MAGGLPGNLLVTGLPSRHEEESKRTVGQLGTLQQSPVGLCGFLVTMGLMMGEVHLSPRAGLGLGVVVGGAMVRPHQASGETVPSHLQRDSLHSPQAVGS